MAGLTRAALANYETGRTKPKARILKEIANRLGLSPDFLMDGQIRHEHDLNILMTGKRVLSECHETDDELAMVSALRAVEPETVKTIVDLLLRQIEENASTRERMNGHNTVNDIARLGAIFKAGGLFQKGSSAKEIDAFFASLARSART